jgi:hypothetical protein
MTPTSIQVTASSFDWESIADACGEIADEFNDMQAALKALVDTGDAGHFYHARGIDAGMHARLDDLRALFNLVRYAQDGDK